MLAKSYHDMSFIEATLTASLATPQSAAVIAGFDRARQDNLIQQVERVS
jgi:hypothetical protein